MSLRQIFIALYSATLFVRLSAAEASPTKIPFKQTAAIKKFIQSHNEDLKNWAKNEVPAQPTKENFGAIFHVVPTTVSIWANKASTSAFWAGDTIMAVENSLQKTGKTIFVRGSGESLIVDSEKSKTVFVGEWDGKSVVITRSVEDAHHYDGYIGLEKWATTRRPLLNKGAAEFDFTDPKSKAQYQLSDPLTKPLDARMKTLANGKEIASVPVKRIGRVGGQFLWQR